MNSYQEINNVFRSRKVVLELLSDRGYIIPDDVSDINVDTYRMMYNNKNIDLYVNNGVDDFMYVKFFTDNNSFKKKNILELCDKVQSITEESVRLIIVFMNNKLPTNATEKDLKNNIFRSTELFPMKTLMFNITKSNLVPKHRLISDQGEVLELLELYNCSLNELPKLKLTDPIARYYGYKIGDVCEITRNSPITGISYYYRFVEL
jgi:DNA-directed RNA polymerase I, II, and III subunit RPABC1